MFDSEFVWRFGTAQERSIYGDSLRMCYRNEGNGTALRLVGGVYLDKSQMWRAWVELRHADVKELRLSTKGEPAAMDAVERAARAIPH